MMGKAEFEAISAFLQLVVKLNEATFRPLFRRLFDWAFVNGASKLFVHSNDQHLATSHRFCSSSKNNILPHIYVPSRLFQSG